MNWKTTIPGLVAGVAQILKAFNIDIPQEILDGVTAIAVFVLGYFAKDKDVTGGTRG